MIRTIGAALALALAAMPLQAAMLTFDEVTADWQGIGGFTDAQGVMVSYPAGAAGWISGYGDLHKVVFANTALHIAFAPPSDKAVKLISFDAAGWAGADRDSQWSVTGHSASEAFVAPGAGHRQVSMNVKGAKGETLTLVLGPDAYYTGFDNIHYSVTPIPGALPLLATAVGGLALAARRRRAA